MRSLRYTREAKADLEAIAVYTLERYGAKQAQSYRSGFEKFFALLAEHPMAGSSQSGIHPRLRRIVHQSHAIYYRVDQDEITIARNIGSGPGSAQRAGPVHLNPAAGARFAPAESPAQYAVACPSRIFYDGGTLTKGDPPWVPYHTPDPLPMPTPAGGPWSATLPDWRGLSRLSFPLPT
jgi:toxin ParE1/3/4